MEVKLTRIGPMSYAKILAIGMAIGGFIYGIILGAIISILPALAQQDNPFMSLGWLLVIVMPILYGIIGFLGGLLCAAIYNFLAGMVGGIQMKLE